MHEEKNKVILQQLENIEEELNVYDYSIERIEEKNLDEMYDTNDYIDSAEIEYEQDLMTDQLPDFGINRGSKSQKSKFNKTTVSDILGFSSAGQSCFELNVYVILFIMIFAIFYR